MVEGDIDIFDHNKQRVCHNILSSLDQRIKIHAEQIISSWQQQKNDCKTISGTSVHGVWELRHNRNDKLRTYNFRTAHYKYLHQRKSSAKPVKMNEEMQKRILVHLDFDWGARFPEDFTWNPIQTEFESPTCPHLNNLRVPLNPENQSAQRIFSKIQSVSALNH